MNNTLFYTENGIAECLKCAIDKAGENSLSPDPFATALEEELNWFRYNLPYMLVNDNIFCNPLPPYASEIQIDAAPSRSFFHPEEDPCKVAKRYTVKLRLTYKEPWQNFLHPSLYKVEKNFDGPWAIPPSGPVKGFGLENGSSFRESAMDTDFSKFKEQQQGKNDFGDFFQSHDNHYKKAAVPTYSPIYPFLEEGFVYQLGQVGLGFKAAGNTVVEGGSAILSLVCETLEKYNPRKWQVVFSRKEGLITQDENFPQFNPDNPYVTIDLDLFDLVFDVLGKNKVGKKDVKKKSTQQRNPGENNENVETPASIMKSSIGPANENAVGNATTEFVEAGKKEVREPDLPDTIFIKAVNAKYKGAQPQSFDLQYEAPDGSEGTRPATKEEIEKAKFPRGKPEGKKEDE